MKKNPHQKVKSILEKVTVGDLLKMSEKNEKEFENEQREVILLCVSDLNNNKGVYGIKWLVLNTVDLRVVLRRVKNPAGEIAYWSFLAGRQRQLGLNNYVDMWESSIWEIIK